jgi:hypothetical protein
MLGNCSAFSDWNGRVDVLEHPHEIILAFDIEVVEHVVGGEVLDPYDQSLAQGPDLGRQASIDLPCHEF